MTGKTLVSGSVVLALLVLTACTAAVSDPIVRTTARDTGAIIDSHFHAAWPGDDDAAGLAARLTEMEGNGIGVSTLFITTPDDLEKWVEAAPGKFIAGPMLPCPRLDKDRLFCFPDSGGWPDLAWLESEIKTGRIGLLGEMLFSYAGVAPNDARMEPYWALAEKDDIPVMVHTNSGPPPGRGPRRHDGCCPDFNDNMGDPALMRPVLSRHPKLRVSLQHSGFPTPGAPDGRTYWDETIGLMRDYPNVHADRSVLNAVWDEEEHKLALQRFIDEGLVDRIMFGSDNFPAETILARLEVIDSLSDAQRQAILHDNAARFFRISGD